MRGGVAFWYLKWYNFEKELIKGFVFMKIAVIRAIASFNIILNCESLMLNYQTGYIVNAK